MPKQKIEFEIDVPEGWELTGEFRQVAAHEPYVAATWNQGNKISHWSGVRSLNNFFIVRKVFNLPDWIPSGWWVSKDRDGQIYCYENEPGIDRNQKKWVAGGPYALITALFDAYEIDLPKVHWDEAKWQQREKEEVKDY